MQHFVIIGNGVAGIEAAHTIRERHLPKHAKITVISKETEYFFSRTALMYAYMNQMERRDLEPFERKSYEKQEIDLLLDTVTDLDADKKIITLEKGGELPYDKLLIATGAKPRHVDFKGLDKVKEGFVNFVSMQDLDECERLTPSTSQAVVVGGGLIGIELVECLNFHKVKTTFLVREDTYWPVALAKEEGELVAEHIRHHGVDLRLAEELDEILVDDNGRVRAVITNKGDEIPCQMLGMCIGVVASVDWLKGATTPPEIGRSLSVDRAFKTSLPDVYGAGDCVQIETGEERPIVETIWYSAKRHGRLAALSMLGDTVNYDPPLFYNSSKFFEIEYTTVGDVIRVPDNARALWRELPGKHITQRIVYLPEEGDRVIGFNMLGSRWNHRLLERWVRERRSLGFVKEHLTSAQFDVEFGRAPLEQMKEMEVAP
jgi:NADPH-dependent 2,4-dienoyl-CoA reductase/sulfur reductase-like enzyme